MSELRMQFQFASCETAGSAPIAYATMRPVSISLGLAFAYPLTELSATWHGICSARARGANSESESALNLLRGEAAPIATEAVSFGKTGVVAAPVSLNAFAQSLLSDLGLLRAAAVSAQDQEVTLSGGRVLSLKLSDAKPVRGSEPFSVDSQPVTSIRTSPQHRAEETTTVEELRFDATHYFPALMILRFRTESENMFLERRDVLLLSPNAEDLKSYFVSQRPMVQLDASG